MLRLALILLSFACSLQAAPLPSSVSGAYLTPDRLCRLELSRAGVNHVDVDLLCVADDGTATYSRTRAEAWAGSCPGDPYTANVFSIDGGAVLAGFAALDSFDGARMYVRVAADPSTLYNGGGTPQTWIRVRPIGSASPYTCASAPTSAAPPGSLRANCRLNPRAPWCRG